MRSVVYEARSAGARDMSMRPGAPNRDVQATNHALHRQQRLRDCTRVAHSQLCSSLRNATNSQSSSSSTFSM